MDPVVHFEMPYEERTRMSGFYASVFGWQSQMMGPEMGNYVVVMTSEAESDKTTGRPKQPGVINGGFYEKPKDGTGQCPSVVIAVKDIEASMKKVELSGGRVLGEPMEIPKVGKYVSFQDTEGNRASMLQPSAEM